MLQVDAVVNPTSETMDDNSLTCQRIFSRAGPALNLEIDNEIKGTFFIFLFLSSIAKFSFENFVYLLKDSLY